TGEAVVCLLGEVPQHEAVLGEPVRDRRDGGAQALVLAGKEAEDRRQQRRGVEGLGLVVLAQDASGGAVLEDVPADLLGGRVPRLLPLAAACDCTIGQRRLGSRWLLRVRRRIESSTAPKTSFWRWSNAPLPTRTGRAPAYPDRSSRVVSVRSRRPSMPYMICSPPSATGSRSPMN